MDDLVEIGHSLHNHYESMLQMRDFLSLSPRICVFFFIWISIFILLDRQFPDQLELNRHLQQYLNNADKSDNVKFDSFANFRSVFSFGTDGSLGVSYCLRPTILPNLTVYLNALQKSVRIISLPAPLSADLRSKCNSLGPMKKAIPLHPHSIELHFPQILTAMSKHASNQYSDMSAPGVHDKDFGITNRDDFTNSVNKSSSHGISEFHLDPLWRTSDSQSRESAEERLASDPLFFYVAALPYHRIYCTKKRNNKEEWEGRDLYWMSVADYLLADDNHNLDGDKTFTFRNIFMQNMGSDFLFPASHPQSGPSRIHPRSLSYLQRATFLKTDFDISGSVTKDIIVPYYTLDSVAVLPADERLGLNARKCRRGSSSVFMPVLKSFVMSTRPTLMFFAGSDNPAGGFRSMFLQSLTVATENIHSIFDFHNLHKASFQRSEGITGTRPKGLKSDVPKSGGIDSELIFFSLESFSLPPDYYERKMLNSTFCLILRGDTTSSKRLFSAIACGCVPVIISDGIQLPFASIIDYTTFTLTFSESVVNDLGSVLKYLISVTPDRYKEMRQALADVRPYLLFGYKYAIPDCDRSPNEEEVSVHFKSPINPVTLTLLDNLMRRESQCLDAQNTGMPATNLCQKLMRRLVISRELSDR